MYSSSKSKSKSPLLTSEGLPLNQINLGADFTATATDVGSGGTSRRIECRPTQLISSPSTHLLNNKMPPSEAYRNDSLMDDDDDLTDYFTTSSRDSNGVLLTIPIATDSCCFGSHIPTLPSFYPLEKSAAFIPQASSSIIADRISSVLKARSIVATYGSANVDCVSKSNVEFRIHLYRGRAEYNQGIIVEVQRRNGFDLSYTQDVYAILDSVQGKEGERCGEAPVSYEATDCGNSCSSEDDDVDYTLRNLACFASLRVISDILCPQDIDETVLIESRDFALVSLASLTSLDRMGQVAKKFSSEVLKSELRRVVFSYIIGQDSMNQTPSRSMLLSLEILANVAKSLGCIYIDNEILSKLVGNIENAKMNPRAASLSCLILKCFNETQPVPSGYPKKLLSAVVEAARYGSEYHSELEMHSQQFLELISVKRDA